MREAPTPTHPAGPPERRLGGPAFGFLAVTVATGVCLAPLYRPDAALESVEALLAGVPLGWWLRAAHAFAAWALLGTAVLHVADVLWRRTEGRAPAGAWWRWALLFPVIVGALLGGFVLRGDAEAGAALAVWRGVLADVPGVGGLLADALLGPPGAGLGVVAAHHAGTFTLAAWLLSADHARRPWPEARDAGIAGVLVLVAAAVVPLSLGPASAPPGAELLGPWYLLGLQGMLLDLPVAAAWLVPAAMMLALGLARHRVPGRWAAGTLAVLLGAGAAWTVRLFLM